MRLIILLAATLALSTAAAQSRPTLRNGDLLFQASEPDEFTGSVKTSYAAGLDSVAYSHVGIVAIEGSDTTVIQAVFRGVVEVPLDSFLVHSDRSPDGFPMVVAARLRPDLVQFADSAVIRARRYLGRPYDFVFSPYNDAVYCSELVQLSYLDADGRQLFERYPMSFKNVRTGVIEQPWIDYFHEHGAPIPEGVPGTHPSQISRSPSLRLLARFF